MEGISVENSMTREMLAVTEISVFAASELCCVLDLRIIKFDIKNGKQEKMKSNYEVYTNELPPKEIFAKAWMSSAY